MSESNGETPEAPARGRVPWGCVGMLGLILTVELLFSRASLDLLRPEFWLWYATGKAADRAAGAEILCLGTSQTNYGVIPQVLEARLGRSVYNLAMCSSPPHADYFLLKRVLAAGGRPKAVVLDLNPHLMAVGYWGSIRFFPNLLSVGECLDLGWTTRDPDFVAQVLLTRALPSVLGRFDIRNAIQAALDGRPHSLRQPTLNYVWNRESNQGAMVLPRRTTPQLEIKPIDHEWFTPPSWRHERVNTLYARRLLKLAAAYQIKVFLLIPPIDSRLEEVREQRGLASAYREFARGLQAHHPNLVVVEGTHAGYPPQVFHDAVHVDRTGATVLTSDLAEILRAHLDDPSAKSSRWVALPRYHEITDRSEVVEIGSAVRAELPETILR